MTVTTNKRHGPPGACDSEVVVFGDPRGPTVQRGNPVDLWCSICRCVVLASAWLIVFFSAGLGHTLAVNVDLQANQIRGHQDHRLNWNWILENDQIGVGMDDCC
jgi:hypothetical protein